MKKLLAILLCLAMIGAMLASCDKGEAKDEGSKPAESELNSESVTDSETESDTESESDLETEGELPKVTTPSEGLSYNLNTAGEGYVVVGIGMCTDTDIVIPTTHKELPVTGIGACAFYESNDIVSIEIPDSIVDIGDYAFSGCTALKYNEYDNAYYLGNEENKYHALIRAKNSEITECAINDNTKIIGDSAFWPCPYLENIEIPEGVISIGSYAFSYCTRLAHVSIPNSIEKIGRNPFVCCDNLEYSTYGNMHYLGSDTNKYMVLVSAISDELGNMLEYDIHEQTKFILGISHCYGLKSVKIPKNVIQINSGLFSDCAFLESITVENGNTKYRSESNCLIEVETKILISGCKNSIIPSDSTITSIGNSAFYGRVALANIIIPNSITSIGDYAFGNCGLTDITFQGTKSEWTAILKGEHWNASTGDYTVTCTDGILTYDFNLTE